QGVVANMQAIIRSGAVGFIVWLDGRRGSKLNVISRCPKLALRRRPPPTLRRPKAEGALQAQTSTAQTNHKAADMTSARQAHEAHCPADLHTRQYDEPSDM